MAEACSKNVDPRTRRTRLCLAQALEKLLETKKFEEISVQDIAEAAAVNRVTFYDHYPDKFALLECMVAGKFHQLLMDRGVVFNGTCAAALRAIVLGVCDFLAAMPRPACGGERRIEAPHLESAIIAVVRKILVDGMRENPPCGGPPLEIAAAAASWAIYGGAKEWLGTGDRGSSEEAAEAVLGLIAPMLRMDVAFPHPVDEGSPTAR